MSFLYEKIPHHPSGDNCYYDRVYYRRNVKRCSPPYFSGREISEKETVILKDPIFLTELCRDVLGRWPKPDVWYLDIPGVIEWVKKTLGLHGLEDVITRNNITGRRLPLLTGDDLVKMNVIDFETIKKFLNGIDNEFKLVGKTESYVNRARSLAPRNPFYYYYAYISQTGEFYDNYDIYKYLSENRLIHVTDEPKCFIKNQSSLFADSKREKIIVARTRTEDQGPGRFFMSYDAPVDKSLIVRLNQTNTKGELNW